MSRFTYDYYTVSLPGDLFDDIDRLADYAIDTARENAKLYAIPAAWTAKHIRGDIGDNEIVFRVCRKRNKR
jgi:ABC-type glycerol-3-phosphate transport system substrate-binding protein